MGGSSGGKVSAPTVTASKIDIEGAINDIMKSAEVLIPALQTAGINLMGTLGQSNALLAGYGDVANNATTQMQLLLGMTPVDLKTKQLQQQVQSLRANFLGSEMALGKPELRDQFGALDTALAGALGNTDPTKRQAAYDTTLAAFQKLHNTLTATTPGTNQTRVDNIDSLRGDERLTLAKANMIASKYGDGSLAFSAPTAMFKGMQSGLSGYDRAGFLTGGALRNALGGGQVGESPIEGTAGGTAITASQFIDWFKQQKAYTGGSTTSESSTPGSKPGINNYQVAAQLQGMMQNFQYDYNPQGQQALSGSQLQDMIQKNPEYTASYDSGMQAIERAAAAGGMLSSGNTLKAASDFGSQLAGTVYGNLYARLAGLQTNTLPVAQQAAANQAQNAATIFNTATADEQARSSALLQTGQLKGQTAQMQAQLNTQASMANAQNQLQASIANQQAKQQSSAGMGQLAGALVGKLFF